MLNGYKSAYVLMKWPTCESRIKRSSALVHSSFGVTGWSLFNCHTFTKCYGWRMRNMKSNFDSFNALMCTFESFEYIVIFTLTKVRYPNKEFLTLSLTLTLSYCIDLEYICKLDINFGMRILWSRLFENVAFKRLINASENTHEAII